MRKLKLDVDTLEVASFEIRREAAGRGTVQAHDPPRETRIDITCNWSCGATRCEEWTCVLSCAVE